MGGAAVVTEGEVEVIATVEADYEGSEGVAAAVTCVLVALCCLLGARYLRQRHLYWQRRGVPCPPAPFLVGHTLARMGLTRPFTEFFDELYYDYNGRDYCGYYDFLKPSLFVGNPQLIKTILVQDFQCFADRRTFDLSKVSPVANDMLTNARGTHWRRIRSAVSPAFTKNRTRRLYPLLLQRARHFLRLVSSNHDKEEFSPKHTSSRDPATPMTKRGTPLDTDGLELSGENKLYDEVKQENLQDEGKYSYKTALEAEMSRENVENAALQLREMKGEAEMKQEYYGYNLKALRKTKTEGKTNQEILENKSKYTTKIETDAEVKDNTSQTTKHDSSALNNQQTTITTAPDTTQHHAAHTRHKQMVRANEEIISTTQDDNTGNTRLNTPPTTRMQHRAKKHDTNNNSTKSAASEVEMEDKADTQTHKNKTRTSVTTPRRRNVSTVTGVDSTRKRGGETATREELKQKDDIEARRECGRYTMDAIASCAFGLECDALNKEAALFPTMAARVFQLSATRALKMILVAVSPKAAQMASAAGLRYTSEEFTFFLRVAKHALAARRAAHTPRGDFLDLLLEAAGHSKQGLSDDTLAAQAILFLLAGYDNTANTMAMSLHLLAHHPAARARLRREVARGILGSSSGSGRLSYDDVTELPYLDAVVCETLRLYPAAPVIERVCTEPCRLGGVEVEVGTGVVVPVWCLHRDPAHWPRPHQFKPERFLKEARKTHTPFTYLPFGAGPRSCVGIRFAQVAVKAGLASLLSGADVVPSPASPFPTVLDPRVLTLQPKDGLYVSLKPSPLPDMITRELEEYPPVCVEDEAIAAELMGLFASGSVEMNVELTD